MPISTDTRYSLLARLARPADPDAWQEFISIYQGAIFRYSRHRGLQEADALNVVQQVMLAVHEAIQHWKPSGRQGSFRAWLFQTAHRHCLRALRDCQRADRGAGGTSVFDRLQSLAHDNRELESEEQSWRRWAFCCAAGQVQRTVETVTWRAFWMTAVEGLPPTEVAKCLGMKMGSVYAARCRVLARIRERTDQLSREVEVEHV